MATNDLRPTQDNENTAAVRNAVRQLWSLYGEMKRLVAYAATCAEFDPVTGEIKNPEALAQTFGYQTDVEKATKFFKLLIAAAEYTQAETDAKGNTNPMRALMHGIG